MRSSIALVAILLLGWDVMLMAEDFRVHVKSYEIEGELPVSQQQSEHALSNFVGDGKSLEDISSAAKALQELLQSEGYSFYRVILPPQKIEDGSIRLKVIRFNISSISVTGNKHHSEENVLTSIPALIAGTSPNMREIQRGLQIANANPSKAATVLIKESSQQDAIDAEIQVRDQNPLSIYAALGNTGSEDNGDWRATFGIQHANLFDRDHSATLSYTTSPEDPQDVQQTGVFYRIPFYSLGGELNGYYIDSTVDSGTISDFDVSGSGEFYGVNFKYALPRQESLSHSLLVGMDDRYFENETIFLGIDLGVPLRTRPFILSYQGQWKHEGRTLDYSVSWSKNMGGGGRNDSEYYTANRLGSDLYWQAVRYSLSYQQPFDNGWEFRASLEGQWTDDVLVDGEQFGIGGMYSVRGYEEREISGDKGIMARIEARIPFSKANARPYLFVDAGKVDLNKGIIGRDRSDTASSMGVGVDWAVTRKSHLSASVAHALEDLIETDAGESKLHVQYVYRFM